MKLAQTVPELSVPDVRAAQEYYRDKLGFEIAWFNEAGRIGAVSSGDCAIFFRESAASAPASTFWMFAENVDGVFEAMKARGADIADPLSDKPWGLRQFTMRDFAGNLFHVHHDL